MTAVCIRGRGAASASEQAATRDSSSDETLISRIADGDQLAMRKLFARHRVALYRWLLRLVGDEASAEDLLSEVFLDVWQQAASFERRSSVSTWLLAIARYKALSARRRRTEAELDEATVSAVPDIADDPEVVLQKKNRAEAPILGLPIARAPRGHRPRLLSRQIAQGSRRDRRHQGGHGEDAHVLRAQEAGGVSCETLVFAARARSRFAARDDLLVFERG
jgi:RNA polymerase sigma factor (sigma-70 family)